MFLVPFEPHNCFRRKLDRIYYSDFTWGKRGAGVQLFLELASNWSRIQDPASYLVLWASKNGNIYSLFLFSIFLLFVCFLRYLQGFPEDFKIVISTWAYKQIRAAISDRSVLFFSSDQLLSVLFPYQAWLSLLLGHSYLLLWWDLGCIGGDPPYFRQNLGKSGTTHSEFIKKIFIHWCGCVRS